MIRSIAAALAAISLSACVVQTAPQVTTAAPPPPPAGITPINVTSPTLSGGYTYGTSLAGSSTIEGYAQLLPTTFTPADRTNGSATLNGTYSVNMVPVNVGLSARAAEAVRNAPITLTADFQNRTLTGNSGNFSVNGRFASGILTGSASYREITSNQLSGIVANDRAIGVFVGTNGTTNTLIAGGFDVSN